MDQVTLLGPVVFTDRKSTKTGNAYRAADVQGLLHTDDGKQEVFAMLLMPARGEKGVDLPAGRYVVETSMKVDFRDRKLTSEVIGFRPVAEQSKGLKAAA